MTQRVFNGQDVSDLRFTFEEDAVITSDFQGVYRGPVYKCHMTYVPVAGRLATEFRKSKGDPPTFTVWLAAVRSPALGSPVLVPVFASGTFDGRKFIAYASRATIAGQPLNQLSRAGDY